MSDLVGNPEDWFPHNEANILIINKAYALSVLLHAFGQSRAIGPTDDLITTLAEEIRCVFDGI